MGYRSFKDTTGADWHAWDVVPQLAERRLAERRQGRQTIAFWDRRRAQRRIIGGRRSVLSAALAGGWLCFEGPTEKRRLIPIPGDWSRCPDQQLQEYCRLARPVRRSTEVHQNSGPAE